MTFEEATEQLRKIYPTVIATAEQIAEAMAEMDAVSVIRCKDCARRYDSCPMVVRVGGYISFITEDEDFCSRGRRKVKRNE